MIEATQREDIALKLHFGHITFSACHSLQGNIFAQEGFFHFLPFSFLYQTFIFSSFSLFLGREGRKKG
jgi:hypothetical protein